MPLTLDLSHCAWRHFDEERREQHSLPRRIYVVMAPFLPMPS